MPAPFAVVVSVLRVYNKDIFGYVTNNQPTAKQFMSNSTFNYGWSGGKVTPEFGLVVLVGAFAWMVNLAFTAQVGRSRKKFNIQAPRMTETFINQPSGGETGSLTATYDQVPEEYLRYQRVHLNNVENAPFFYGLLILAGIGYPFGAFIAGLVYQLGRIVGGVGYYYSSQKRQYGGFFHLGEFVLVGLAIATGIQLLML